MKRVFSSALFLVGALIASSAVVADSAESRPLIVQTVDTSNGLPQGTVMAALLDRQGFVWLGTEDGLVRYDGHDTFRYAYNPNREGSLPANYVNAIVEDAKGDLWVALKGAGLARWNRANDTFTSYRHNPGNPNSLSSDLVRNVMIARDGRIWIGTADAGVNVIEPGSGRVQRHSLSDNRIQALFQTRNGEVLVGTQAGLAQWMPHAQAFETLSLTGPLAPKGPPHVSALHEDEDGSLWIGTFDAGVLEVTAFGRVLRQLSHRSASEQALAHDDIRALLSDREGRLWIGTADGLDILDRETGQLSHYRHERGDPDSLGDSFIMSLYQDANGLIWIGTRAGGVSRWNPRSWELGGHRPDWLQGKLVTAFADADDGGLWVASLGGGLVLFDPDSGRSRTLEEVMGKPGALPDSRVMSLLRDRRGTLWVGTMTKGLWKLADGKLSAVPVAPGTGRGTSAAGIVRLYETSRGELWIGTHGGGANVLDLKTGVIRQLPHGGEPGAVSSDVVTSLLEDDTGAMWIGTEGGGLDLADANGHVLHTFKSERGNTHSITANTIYALAKDHEGGIWAGTDGGGLEHIRSLPADGEVRFEHLSQANGLSSDTVYGVVTDTSGYLWLSGNAGLTRLDPRTGTRQTYHREHGLQGEEFNFGAYHVSTGGRVVFGGPGGFNVFEPRRLTAAAVPPRVALMRVEVLGAPLRAPRPYWLLEQVELDYRDSIISFDLAALDYASPRRNRLAYRIAGLTDKWIDLGTERRVTLTNLDGGSHVLEVRATNADSVSSDQPLRIRIQKRAAPWQSTGAYIAYALLLLGMAASAVHLQRRKLRNAQAMQRHLESEVVARTQELRETNSQLREASEAKSSFLARMSHELRTPMNGVVGMAELLAHGQLSPQQSRQTQTIRESAHALLRILNDLLDLSKAQAGRIELEMLPVDPTLLLEECAALFSAAADQKGVALIVCPPRDRSLVIGDPLRLRQVLMNLIGNAIKFTERGEVVIECDMTPMVDAVEAQLRFQVRDTGIGLSGAAIGRIFEPFEQADETTARRFGGTGLGLTICRELVELMGGHIEVRSEPGSGATFDVNLKVRTTAAPAVQREPSRKMVHVVTRRTALLDSLCRYLSQLGHHCIGTDPESVRSLAPGTSVVVLDASCVLELEPVRLRELAAVRLLVVASPREMQQLDAVGLQSLVHVLSMPLYREALREALDGPVSQISSTVSVTPPGGRGRVLIVEDDNVNAAVAEGYLSILGCHSVRVTNGADAIALCASREFDLIFMDLNMPGLDGYETVKRVRASGYQLATPIIALTANEAASHRPECVATGMNDILSKPYTLNQCSEMVERWLPQVAPGTKFDTRDAASLEDNVIANMRKLPSGAGGDLFARLARLYATETDAAIAALKAAVERDDTREATRLCHKLKSACANVGAVKFGKLLDEMERASRAGELSVVREKLAGVLQCYPIVLANLTMATTRASA